ncbi:MAG: hypothetical protein CSB24_00475 [Deltaproteobacteria bacterium]|nr:MAG: hypothetical protein CSB24_00475 [Deltaproteobacteria bacterium]
MLVEGVKLMLVGMTTVLLFLSFMILLLQLTARLTSGIAARELAAAELERKQKMQADKKRKNKDKIPPADNQEEIAVITAAIAAFEAEKAALSR